MEEEDHIHSTQLPSLIAALTAAAMAAGLLPLAALLSFSLLTYFSLLLLCTTHLVLLSRCLFIDKNGTINSNSYSTMVAAKL
jgi:hypothetical protein